MFLINLPVKSRDLAKSTNCCTRIAATIVRKIPKLNMAITPIFFLSFNPNSHSWVSGNMSTQTSSARTSTACGSVSRIIPTITLLASLVCHPIQKKLRGVVWKKARMKNVTPIRTLNPIVILTTRRNLGLLKIRRKKHRMVDLTSTRAAR
jgi:hypothetical protein